MSSKKLSSNKVEAIKRALEFVATREDSSALEKELGMLTENIEGLLKSRGKMISFYEDQKKRDLLPIERTQLNERFEKDLRFLNDDLKEMGGLQSKSGDWSECTKLEMRIQYSVEGCVPMGLFPLSWRFSTETWKAQMPLFWLFDPFGNGIGGFGVHWNGDSRYLVSLGDELPKKLQDALVMDDAKHLLHNCIYDQLKSVRFETTFIGGAIPERISSRVKDLQKRKVFSKLYFLAEVVEWKMDASSERVQGYDPIVVGWCDELQQLYYIDHFDLTEHESAYLKDTPAFQLARQLIEQARSK